MRTRLLLLALSLVLLTAPGGAVAGAGGSGGDDAALAARVERILRAVPLIDGHNDLPWQVRARSKGDIDTLPLATDTSQLDEPMHTDLPRLRRGRVGGQFWSVYVPDKLGADEAVRVVLEQIDVVHRLCERFPEHLELALTAADVVRIHKAGRVASLIGMEGGHSIGNSMGTLRMLYRAGARYMGLTHWHVGSWADAATDAPKHGGLSDFGRDVVREMNRLGMLVDLAHVSVETMRDVLEVSEAPSIVSHSGAFAINPHPRNVPDDVLKRLGKAGGVIMVDFLPAFVSAEVSRWVAEAKAEKGRNEWLYLGDPKGAERALEAWKKQHPEPRATLADVVRHIDHIRSVAGVDAIGIGSDFDGMGVGPVGLEDVSKYPALLAALLARGYSDEDVKKIAGLNVLRALRGAEAVARRLQRAKTKPSVRQLEDIAPATGYSH